MSFEQLKREIAALNAEEQSQLISYTLQLRYAQDEPYHREVTDRLSDGDAH